MTKPADPADASIAIGGNATVSGAVVGINTGTINTIVQVAQVVTSPRQLRAPLPDFVGRAAEIEQLLAALRRPASHAALTLIHGMGGIGKTELALRAAHDLRGDYPDAQLFLSLGGPQPGAARSAVDGLRDVIRAFDPSSPLPDDVESLAGRYCGLLNGKRALVLLDDAPDAATVRPFLPPAGCALLVTSRVRLALGGERSTIGLATFARDESRALLLRLAPRLTTDPALGALLERCGDLPLAVRVVGATLAGNPALAPKRYLARLADEARRLKALRDDDIDVYTVLAVGDDLLQADDPALAARWRMLSACPAPFEAATAASIWGEADPDALDDALGALIRRSLLNYDPATGRYRIHALLRDLAHARCPAEDSYAAHLRHACHYLELLREAERLYQAGHSSVKQGLTLFGGVQPHLIAAQIWAAETTTLEARRLCLDYALAAEDILFIRLRPQERLAWFNAALAAARVLDDRRGEWRALGKLGGTYLYLDDAQRTDAYYMESLTVARNISDRYGESRALAGLGLAKSALGDEREALLYYKQWLTIAAELGDRYGEGRALLNMGGAHFQLGDARSALKCYAQSLVILRDLGENRTEGVVLNNLGDVYITLGDTRRAADSYSQSLAIMEEIGDQYFEAIVRWSMGELLAGQGEYNRAAQLMQALVDYERSASLPEAEQSATILAQVQERVKAERE
jgi:tetratricopeptide (TPR) repeat protein